MKLIEEWKDVRGFEEYYKISNTGRIIRKERYSKWKDKDAYTYVPEKELKFTHDKDGYLKTAFRVDGKRYYKRVHVLVALTFIDNPKNNPIVNHKNGIKDDNRASNLEWVTFAENVQHSFDVLGRKGYNGGTNKPINKIDKITGEIIKRYNSMKEASLDIGVTPPSIAQSIKRENGTCGGFIWEFCNEDVTTIENTLKSGSE